MRTETKHQSTTTISLDKGTIDKILTLSKDIYDYIKNPILMTTNDVSEQMLLNLSKTFKNLEELKVMFENKSMPSSLKEGKADVEVISLEKSSKSPSP